VYKIVLFIQVCFYIALAFIVKLFVKKNSKKEKTILFLPAFFPENAGYHWRVQKWADVLQENGYSVTIKQANYKDDYYKLLGINHSLLLIKFLNKRFWHVLSSRKYNKVIVRRELLPFNEYGNLFLEKLLLKIHPDAILDFDDDIAFSKGEPREIKSLYGKILGENGNKFTESLNMYSNFFVGSNYLKNYVLNINPNAQIEVIPTCVDYEKYAPKVYDASKKEIVFGWVGSNSNLFLLDSIIDSLNTISKNNTISLLVISGKDYKNSKAAFPIVNIPWSLESEIEDIKKMDIGLMPLLNTKRDKGKAGFKLIQYMGLGIASIASNVTVNGEIVDDHINGFLVDEDWTIVLEDVISKKQNFEEIGRLARKKINDYYSFNSNLPKYLNLVHRV